MKMAATDVLAVRMEYSLTSAMASILDWKGETERSEVLLPSPVASWSKRAYNLISQPPAASSHSSQVVDQCGVYLTSR